MDPVKRFSRAKKQESTVMIAFGKSPFPIGVHQILADELPLFAGNISNFLDH